ncbi:MAG: sugar phosphate isomerase/epimerase [Candidatus Hydrogenedentes bacterium]|nr:sugar phosphate isomerase/epimerase [Candidatus Hydrogenedentota bacterium]
MFRLASFTDEISHDLEKACRTCREFGAAGAEIRGVWQTPSQKLTDAQVRDIKRIVSDHGMLVCSLASPFGKCDLESAQEVADHMDILRRCSEIALELDCTLVRGFAFWNRGKRDKPWEQMLRAYEPVPGILEEKGTILGLENEAACYVGTAHDTRAFLDSLGCDRVRAIWDPANHVQDPGGDSIPAYPDGYELIRDDIIHVHVKDAIVAADGSRPNVFLGMGIVGWEEQLRALKDHGYSGYISLETHVNAQSFPSEWQARYGHLLTGEGREGASKVCLAWLRDALAVLA